MVDAHSERKHFVELLPFYVNGTLDADEHDWVDAYLAAHPNAENELKFMQILRESTRNTTSKVPEAQRLERLLGELRASRPAPSLLQKAVNWLQGVVRIPAPALAVVSMVVLAQAGIIGSLLSSGSEPDGFRGVRPECTIAPAIRVQFNPDAKHAHILLVLRSVEAIIQNGPTETGALWLAVPEGRSLDETQAMLRSSPLVEEVVVVKERQLPPECAK
jgi:hypothetical protein